MAEVAEVFVAHIHMRFLRRRSRRTSSNASEATDAYRLQIDDAIEMMHVDMHEHAKESAKQLFTRRPETLRKRCTDMNGKDRFVVDDRFHPFHQQRDVVRSGQRRWLLVFRTIAPAVRQRGNESLPRRPGKSDIPIFVTRPA